MAKQVEPTFLEVVGTCLAVLLAVNYNLGQQLNYDVVYQYDKPLLPEPPLFMRYTDKPLTTKPILP